MFLRLVLVLKTLGLCILLQTAQEEDWLRSAGAVATAGSGSERNDKYADVAMSTARGPLLPAAATPVTFDPKFAS